MKRLLFTIMAVNMFSDWSVFTARAGEMDQETKVTVQAPLDVGDVTLVPGQYVFKLAYPDTGRNAVEIINSDTNRLVATVFANATRRIEPTSDNVFTLYETPAGEPARLRSWFYPGRLDGLEFPPMRPGH